MRVISGIYKGRVIDGYKETTTRPTTDRVKESLFSMINLAIPGSICLDLFSGSGSLGIEALSNGAKYCYFNDSNNGISNVLKNNLQKLDIKNALCTKLDYMTCLRSLVSNKLDIIFIDCPYDMDIINKIGEYIYENNMLSDEGLIVYEHNNYCLNNDHYEVYKEKKYGNILITIYKLKKM